MADSADDDRLGNGLSLPWDLPDQIDDVERQVARQARKFEQVRSVIAEASLMFGAPGAKPVDG